MKIIVAKLLGMIIDKYHPYFFEDDVPEGITNVWRSVVSDLLDIIKDLEEGK